MFILQINHHVVTHPKPNVQFTYSTIYYLKQLSSKIRQCHFGIKINPMIVPVRL